jgi:hypothetical protein
MLRETLRERYGIKKPTRETIASKIKELRDERSRLRGEIERRLDVLRSSFPSTMDGGGED